VIISSLRMDIGPANFELMRHRQSSSVQHPTSADKMIQVGPSETLDARALTRFNVSDKTTTEVESI
jgi:hypothetical protein